MKFAKGRFFVMGGALLAMMILLIVQLGMLTIANGENFSQAAESRSTRTIAHKGTRGRILDRNGVVLAYSESSYNVEFFRDPERRSTTDSALYTEALIRAIQIIEAEGGTTIDTFYINQDENGDYVYKWGVDSEEAVKARYKNFLDAIGYVLPESKKDDMAQWPGAEEMYLYLYKNWQIPEELTFEEARKVMSIRQEVLLNNYRAYQPVVIAYNVSMEVVAQIEMNKDALPGLQTAQSTKRVYPRGTTAAHVLGYLNRSVGKVTPSALAEMGYAEEEYAQYLKTDEETGAVTVDMRELGYDNSDMIGVSGIERSMEAYLNGSVTEKQGINTIEVNKYGTMIRQIENTQPTDGDDVMLTIDIALQQVAEEALQTVIGKIHQKEETRIQDNYADYAEDTANRKNGVGSIKLAQTGAIVVLDVKNGQVLAMASSPSFDPNIFTAGLSVAQYQELFESEYATDATPMRNKAISAKLAPGSIFKMVTSLAGLMENAITLDERISCLYEYYLYDDEGNKINSDPARCHTGSLSKSIAKHSDQNLTRALINSCNYYFYTVANRLGIVALNDWAGKLGLTAPTGIELPGEAVGMVGGQTVLYDPNADLSAQKTSLPRLVYNELVKLLTGYLNQRNMEVDDEALKQCALHLLKLQDGDVSGKGAQIRQILSEDLGIPVGISSVYNWHSQISSLLVELQWKPTLTIRAGIGQGVSLVTPVAVARYVAAIANKGTVYDAHIVDRIVDPAGSVVRVVEPSVYSQIDAPDSYWDAIQQGLVGVVSPEDGGTAAEAFSPEFIAAGYSSKLAGKTGTAQTGENTVDIENTSWFVTYLPKENPEIAVVVCVPNGYSGSSSAAAIEVISKYYLDLKDAAAPENLVAVSGIVP